MAAAGELPNASMQHHSSMQVLPDPSASAHPDTLHATIPVALTVA